LAFGTSSGFAFGFMLPFVFGLAVAFIGVLGEATFAAGTADLTAGFHGK
jgi:hypothetical protein